MRFITTLFVIGWITNVIGQERDYDFYPTSLGSPKLSNSKQMALERRDYLLNESKLDDTELEEIQKLMLIETKHTEIWKVNEINEDWYKYGANYKVEASAELPSLEGVLYDASQANDLNYRTAWVVDGDGIGESITFYFKSTIPQITTVCISNGVVNSLKLWDDHNRVKTLQLRVNGVIYGTFHLSNTRLTQYFNLNGALPKGKSNEDLELSFEILTIYPGNRFNQTAITEIFFDGKSR